MTNREDSTTTSSSANLPGGFNLEAWQEQHWDDLYKHNASSAQRWLEKARTLKRAADLVRTADIFWDGRPDLGYQPLSSLESANSMRTMEMLPVYKLLIGLAIENLAKGIVMASDPERATGRKLRKWDGQQHDLVELVGMTCCDMNDDEQRVLGQLSWHVRWAGRYPVAMDPDRECANTRSKKLNLSGQLPADVELAEEIIKKLGSELTKHRDRQSADFERRKIGPPH